MVIKQKEGLNKNKFLPIFFILIITGFFIFVFAAGTSVLVSPTNYTNLSTTMNFNCTNASVTAAINATLYYNSTGGDASTILDILNITFISTGESGFVNSSLYVGHLTQSSFYNFTCIVANATDSASFSVNNVTIDYTPPAVVFESTAAVVNNGGYKGIIVLNVSVNDTIGTDTLMGVESVFFNITTIAGLQHNFTQASNDSNNYWNLTLDTSGFPEAEYNVTVYANDSKRYDGSTKENHTEFIHIYVDRSGPSAIVLTKSNSTKTTLGIDIAITDALSGIGSACTVEPRTGTTIYGTTTTQTLAVTSLTCGATYTYVVTCTDRAGNTQSSSPYSFKTDSCTGTAAGTSGGSSTSTYTETKSVINKISPGVPQVITTFDSSGIPEVKLEVNSQAENVKISVTEYKTKPSTIAVSNENSYNYFKFETQNLEAKLVKATIKIKVLKSWVTSEGISKEDIVLSRYDETGQMWNELTTNYNSESDDYYYYTVELDKFSYFSIGQKAVTESTKESEEGTDLTWLWIIIGIVVLGAIIGGGVALKSKRKRK